MRRASPIKNPTLAEAFDSLRSDYEAARTSRFRRRRQGIPAMGAGADFHFRSDADYLRIMELSRDFFRNNMVVGQAIRRLVDNIIQEGFTLDPLCADKGLGTELWNRWQEWSTDADQCDIAGEKTWHDFERLALQQTVVDGDVFFVMTEDGSLEAIEAHRCRTPNRTERNVVLGVLLSRTRRREEYWFTADDIDPSKSVSRVGEMRRIRARDSQGRRQVLHLYRPDRFTQTRGVSHLCPVFDPIGMHDDIQFATMVQRQIVSCFAIIHQREVEWNAPPGGDDQQKGERTTETRRDGSTRLLEGIAPGMEIFGEAGEKLMGFSPSVPNPEFFPHAMMILTFIAINLNLPVAVLLLDPSKTNFSGWRGAIDQARISFREQQRWERDRLHTPVYHWKVRQWASEDPTIARALAEDPKGTLAHRWNPPRWAYIEPMKDAAGDLLRVRNVLTSPRRLHAERSADWEEIAEETVADNAYAIREAKKAAAKINAEFPDDPHPVAWRELVTLPTPDGVRISLDATESTAKAEEPGQPDRPERNGNKPQQQSAA